MELSKPEYTDIILLMVGIIDGSVRVKDAGLCHTLYTNLGVEADFEVYKIYPEWPKFSGDRNFPVPCPDGGDPEFRFRDSQFLGDLYDGEYGALRLELAQFIADYCGQRILELGDNNGSK